jgi:hypothetical protein
VDALKQLDFAYVNIACVVHLMFFWTLIVALKTHVSIYPLVRGNVLKIIFTLFITQAYEIQTLNTTQAFAGFSLPSLAI